MKKLSRLLAALTLLAATTVVQATTYSFSYSFNSTPWFTSTPMLVTGSFDGDANGNLIDNLSNISVVENGVAFIGNGTLFSSYKLSSDPLNVTLFAGVASFDGLQNNFNFTDGMHNWFQMVPALGGNARTTSAVIGDWPLAIYAIDAGRYAPTTSNWSITAVPEPASYALLIAGLAVLCFMARRQAYRNE